MRSWTPAFYCVTLLAACGGAGAGSVVSPSGDLVPAAEPTSRAQQRQALFEFGQRLFTDLQAGSPASLLASGASVGRVLDSPAAALVEARRNTVQSRLGVSAADFRPFASAAYAGVCVQGSRTEASASDLGLRADAWLVDRALVVGTRQNGSRVAAWVEGFFVFTNQGFQVIELLRTEPPRWEHSDLEIATCDQEIGVHTPQPIVEVTP